MLRFLPALGLLILVACGTPAAGVQVPTTAVPPVVTGVPATQIPTSTPPSVPTSTVAATDTLIPTVAASNTPIPPTVSIVTATPTPTLEATATATAMPPTAVPPTAVPPTAVPPTAVPPTRVPPTAVPPTPRPFLAQPTPTLLPDANDAPVLPAPTTAPTARKPTAPPVSSQPVRLQIPIIELSQPLVSVGLDKNRVPIVPNHDVAWYNLSANPGQGENVVMWGHVLRFQNAPKIPAPFARVKELKIGAVIAVVTADGVKHNYRVTRVVQVTPDQVAYILPVGSERLTLVSCIGDNVVENGLVTKTHRLITIAEPIK